MNDIDRKINKLKTMRLLFLVFGIISLAVGITIPMAAGWYLGVQAASNETEDFVSYLMNEPSYYIFVIVSTLLINGGLALIILRVTLLGIKLKKLIKEKEDNNL